MGWCCLQGRRRHRCWCCRRGWCARKPKLEQTRKNKQEKRRNKHYIHKLPINRPIAALPGSSLREFAWSIRTSSCGPAREGTPPNGVGWHLKFGQGRASPGKIGQDRANRRIDGLNMKLPVQILRVFRPELAHCPGENASRVHKKVPGDTRGLARQNWHTAPDIFLPGSTWGPFCQSLNCGFCRQLAHWWGPLSQIDKNR